MNHSGLVRKGPRTLVGWQYGCVCVCFKIGDPQNGFKPPTVEASKTSPRWASHCVGASEALAAARRVPG